MQPRFLEPAIMGAPKVDCDFLLVQELPEVIGSLLNGVLMTEKSPVLVFSRTPGKFASDLLRRFLDEILVLVEQEIHHSG